MQAKKEAGGAHYGSVQPWHLQEAMVSSGDAFVDGRRCDVIKYAFRMKGKGSEKLGKLADDLRKAAHCALAAAEYIEKHAAEDTAETCPDCKAPRGANPLNCQPCRDSLEAQAGLVVPCPECGLRLGVSAPDCPTCAKS